MKKLILFLFMLICGDAQSAQIANVEYIHNAIKQQWDITVPYNAALANPRVAANMKYLLTAVDVANEMLGTNTNYASGEYATLAATDTVATDTAVATLIKRQTGAPDDPTDDVYDDGVTSAEYPFAIELVDDTSEFSFLLSAAGNFTIDWGDGTIETISKTNVNEQIVSHAYVTPNAYKIRLGGVATAYDKTVFASGWIPAVSVISVSDYWAVKNLYGRLGRVFPTLSDGTQPRFTGAFMYNEELVSIPHTLFDGIAGKNIDDYMFYSMFEGCVHLTSIPSGLFDSFGDNLGTGGLSYMFADCRRLSDDSARINGLHLYDVWPNATYEQVGGMYMNDTYLSDYAAIPSVWK